jgi:TP901 family phage tail tape measure protein
MKRSADSAKAWTKDLKQVGQQATQLGSALTKTLTLPILGIAAGGAKLASDFESSFAGVRKTVNATEGEFKQMAQAFRDLSKTIPINVNELNRLGEAAGALGIPKAEIVDFSRVMALLGVTTDVTSDMAAESIAKIQNIFGAAGKDTERFASTLVALGNDGASTESQILSMATRIAGAGNAIGMTQGQVLAFASALSSVGIEAEMGGSAISRVFIDIAEAVNQGGSAVEGFARVANKPVEEFARLFKEDAAQAVNAFVVGLSNIKKSGGDLLGTLQELGFSEIRVRDTLLRTAGAGNALTQALQLQDRAWRENSALTEEARKRFETTEDQLKILWNRFKDIGITIGNAFLPVIKSTIGAFDVLLPVVEMLAKGFTALPGPIQLLAIGLAGVTAAAGPLLYIFGQLALSASALTGAFTAKGLATRALTGQITGLTAASSAASVALGVLAKAAGVAAAAFVGWQVGRLIADLTGLDDVIARLVTRAPELEKLRKAAAAGDAEAVTKRIVDLERQREQAIRRGDGALANYLDTQIKAIKNDQTRLAIEDAIRLAVSRGAAATVTYTEAVRFNAEWVAKRTQAQQAETKATEAAIAPTKRHKADLEESSKQLEKLAKVLDTMPEHVSGLTAEFARALPTVIDYHEGAYKVAQSLLGWDRMDAAAQMVETVNAALHLGVPLQRMTAEAQEKINTVVADGIEAYRELGMVAPKALTDLYVATMRIPLDKGPLTQLPGTQLPMPTMPDVSKGFLERAFGSAKDFGSTLAGTIMGAIQGGGNPLKAAGSLIGSTLMGGVAKTITSGAGLAIGGALGGALNMILPGIGALAGPLLGKLGGLFGGLFGKSKGQKENEAANQALDDARAKLLDVFGTVQNIDKIGRAIGVDLAGGWGHAGKKGAEAFAESAEQFEEKLSDVKEEMARLSREGGIASVEILRFRDAMAGTAEVTEFVKGQALGAVQGLKGFLENATVSTAAGAAAMGAVVAAAFGELQAQGMSSGEALKALQPTITALQEQLQKTGLDGGAAFGDLARLTSIAADEIAGPALNAVHSLTQALEGAHNAGFLTQDMFEGLVAEIMHARQAILDEGVASDDVNRLMQQDLQRLWVLTKDHGYAVDETTQAMLDEAEAAGVVGDQYRSAMDRAALAMERVASALESIIGKAQGVGTALDRIPKQIRIGVGFDVEQMPDLPESNAPREFARGTNGFEYFDPSGELVKLHGWEKVTPIGADSGPAPDQPIVIHNTVTLDGQVIDQRTIKTTRSAMARGEIPVPQRVVQRQVTAG